MVSSHVKIILASAPGLKAEKTCYFFDINNFKEALHDRLKIRIIFEFLVLLISSHSIASVTRKRY